MSTYGQLQDRIANDYLNRSDLGTEIANAIQAAIRKYERKRWWFTETKTTSACTVAQEWVALPTDAVEIDAVELYRNSAWEELQQTDYQTIREDNESGFSSVPTQFAIYQNRLQMSPIPDVAYVLRISHTHKPAALVDYGDSNTWTTALEDLIVYHATKLMWATVLRNAEQAVVYQQLEQEALISALQEKEQRLMHGIKPTRF